MLRFFNPHNLRVVFSLIFFAVYITAYPVPQELYKLAENESGEVMFYVSNKPENVPSAQITLIRPFYEVRGNIDNAQALRGSLTDICYQTVILHGEEIPEFLQMKVESKLEIGGGTLYRGSSIKLKTDKMIMGCNVMVYCKGGKIIIGSPVIYGSY